MANHFFQFDENLISISKKAEEKCADSFARIEEISEYNEAKVLEAFTHFRVSESHFAGSTGYGYGDRGREVLDEVFARAVGAEDALVRHNFVSGTHALTVALFGVLRTSDKLVCLTGKPYDTMEEVIGIRGTGNGSL
ncbi:MAG: methionine gamma-lyase family protein, partial [Oscillospiraceae bacterium]